MSISIEHIACCYINYCAWS